MFNTDTIFKENFWYVFVWTYYVEGSMCVFVWAAYVLCVWIQRKSKQIDS